MTDAKGVFIIGARAQRRRGRPQIPGTRIIACEKCKAPTRFAPSSLASPEARGGGTFICLTCAAKLTEAHPTFQVAPLSDAQRAELRKAGVL